jgi:hypothetical protein
MQLGIQNDWSLGGAIEDDCCLLKSNTEVVEMAQLCFKLTDDLIIAYAMDNHELFSKVYLKLQHGIAELNGRYQADFPFNCMLQDKSGADWIQSVHALRLQLRAFLCF